MLKATTTKRQTKAAKNTKNKKTPRTMAKRTKISIGKGQRESRAQSMAQNKQLRAQIASEQAQATANPEPEPEMLPAVKLELKKRDLISKLDLPRTKSAKQDQILQTLADANLPWTPIEVGQIMALVANGTGTNYKAGAALVQDCVSRDFLPYKSALRGLTRLFENAYHFKGAERTAAQFKNLYPVVVHDDVGMPIDCDVLNEPIPDFNQLAQLPTSPESIDDILAFKQTLIDSKQKLPTRWHTEHHLLRQFLKNGKFNEAAEQMFSIWKRLGVSATGKVPSKFDPIPFGTIFPKPAAAAQFKPDFPIYYKTIDMFTTQKNWSAAMTTLIYVRTLNRVIDVTPLRELTQNKQWRDFLDIHTHDGFTGRLIVKHFLKELVVRRGYRKDMEDNVPGSAEAVTFSEPTRENALGYSPIINTESEDLVILTDRSYDAKDVIQSKGGIEFTTAHHIVDAFKEHGINASVSYGSKLSSSKEFFDFFVQNGNGIENRPNAPHKTKPIAYDLTVIVPKDELTKFAAEKLVSLPAQLKTVLGEMPVISDTVRGSTKKKYDAEKKLQKAAIAAMPKM